MTDHLQRALDKQSKALAGPTSVEQHIILLKLTELMGNAPDLSTKPKIGASPQRQWVAEVGALVSRVSSEKKITFNASKKFLDRYWDNSIGQIQGLVLDVIEELKLELELSGRADIGSAYAPGEVYKFFADLKSIVNNAQTEIFLIDPYFDGEAFDNYLSDVSSEVGLRIFANKHAQEVKLYTEKHMTQYNSNIGLRKNNKLHDRLILIDGKDCWIMGGSINHAGKKSPTYLIPVGAEITNDKLSIYEDLWNNSQEIA